MEVGSCLAGNLVLHGILIKLIKLVYHRSRPSLSHLVEEGGYSFPSGHSMATAIVLGTLIIIAHQRFKTKIKRLVQGLLLVYIFTVTDHPESIWACTIRRMLSEEP